MIEAAFSPVRAEAAPAAFVSCSPVIERRGADSALLGLAGSDLAGRFRHWRGASGRRYLFSVFPVLSADELDGLPRYREAVVLAVVRARSGDRRILWAGQSGVLPDLLSDGDLRLRQAVAAGANEVHMHLLAKDRASRDAMVADIAG